jgi:hypothetical protein
VTASKKPRKKRERQPLSPDRDGLVRFLRDRKRVGGWVRLGKDTRTKGVNYA